MTLIIVYDLIFLVLFSFFIGFFLYKNKKNLKQEMRIIFLYKTQWGVKLIKYVGNNYRNLLKFLKYFIIATAYVLMAGILYLISRVVYLYLRYPNKITDIVKAPPIAPVIPYFPKLFGMSSFFPPFYFTYFIVALAIVAIVHEFSHGIYMVYNKVRIKSTGIVFLGPILGAFVEQNEKDMNKLSKLNQMSILGAGVFANILFAGFFFLIWMGLFYMTFSATGVMFNNYIMEKVDINSINFIGGIQVSNHTNLELLKIINKDNLKNGLILNNTDSVKFIKIIANKKNYFITSEILKKQLKDEKLKSEKIVFLYSDLPAIKAGLRGIIISIGDKEIKTQKELSEIMKNYKAGDSINIKTKFNGEILNYNLILGENPIKKGKALIGITNHAEVKKNIAENLAVFKDPFTKYEIKSEFLLFLYYLAFWIFLINLLVAFFNMLPVSILDGGRFFYLTILGATKKEKFAKIIYKWVGIIILFAFLLIILSWGFGRFF